MGDGAETEHGAAPTVMEANANMGRGMAPPSGGSGGRGVGEDREAKGGQGGTRRPGPRARGPKAPHPLSLCHRAPADGTLRPAALLGGH